VSQGQPIRAREAPFGPGRTALGRVRCQTRRLSGRCDGLAQPVLRQPGRRKRGCREMVSLVGLKCTRSDHPKCARCFYPNCTNGRNIATGANPPAGVSSVTGNARACETPSATGRAPWPATKIRRLSGTSRACPERSEGSAVAKAPTTATGCIGVNAWAETRRNRNGWSGC